ncbi:MAG: hypothetical protein GY711_01055 [bacterium]|nr:hypothetical protein [bacterium]
MEIVSLLFLGIPRVTAPRVAANENLRFMRVLLRSGFALATVFALSIGSAPQADAQVKTGRNFYVDDSDLGFKFKPPAGWDFIPSSPNEVNLIGKYEPERIKYVMLADGDALFTTCWLLKFDANYKAKELEDGASREDAIKAASKNNHKDLGSWLKANSREVMREYSIVEEKPFRLSKEKATEIIYKGKCPPSSNGGNGTTDIHLWALNIEMATGVNFVLAFNAPANKKKWKKWHNSFKKLAKTFKRVEIEQPAASDNIGMGGLRAKKRAALEDRLRREPGWALYETPNYFVISSHDDKKFVEEMMDRLEAVREVYEADYPIEKALEARKAKEAREAKERKEREKEEGGDEKADKPQEKRTTAARADPMEESKTSVVRLCKNKTEYTAYGGSPRSAGYWNWVEEELVIFDDQERGGRRNTWAVLNHEAFHQYIFYFYGNISPHSWYNEGTGDFYSGYQLNKRKKFDLDRFDWRESTIKEEIKSGKIAPLKDLVRWSQAQYYGNNPIDGGSGSRYPQGWSLIYFLRTGERNKAKGWEATWGSILGTYLDTLAATGDLDESVDKAFDGVDWDALETAWQHYILKGK